MTGDTFVTGFTCANIILHSFSTDTLSFHMCHKYRRKWQTTVRPWSMIMWSSCWADLVFEKNLICCEEDVKFQSLAMDMHPLMCPDLLNENTREKETSKMFRQSSTNWSHCCLHPYVLTFNHRKKGNMKLYQRSCKKCFFFCQIWPGAQPPPLLCVKQVFEPPYHVPAADVSQVDHNIHLRGPELDFSLPRG